MGECGWVQKLCCGGVFPSPGGCLRASVSDGANVRCRSNESFIKVNLNILFSTIPFLFHLGR